jgi:hypothetical protein
MVTLRRAAVASLVLLVAGCGYTVKSNLPEDIRAVHVAPVVNAIDLSAEIGGKEHFRVYRPGVEVELTDAIINQFILEGSLKIVDRERADAVVEARLVDYRRDPLRYDDDDDIQEYRLNVVADVKVFRVSDKKVLWEQPRLTGDTTFFLSGPRAVSEDEAAARAVADAARRVVENVVEIW